MVFAHFQELPRQDHLRLNEPLPDFRSISGKFILKKGSYMSTADLVTHLIRDSLRTRYLVGFTPCKCIKWNMSTSNLG